jgi:hypothetical protein
MKGFLIQVALDTGLAYCAYLWLADSNVAAGNLVLFYMWVIAVLVYLHTLMRAIAIANRLKVPPLPPSTLAGRVYSRCRTAAIIGVAVYLGHAAAATAYAVAWLLAFVRRNAPPAGEREGA